MSCPFSDPRRRRSRPRRRPGSPRSGGRPPRPVRPGHGHALTAPVRSAVVRDRVMLGSAVVPDGQVALAPAPADGVLGPGDVVLQQPDQVPRRRRGESEHGACEAAEQERPFAGLRVHPDQRMLGLVDGGDELLVCRRQRRVDPLAAVEGAGVVEVVGVQDPQPVSQLAQFRRQALVRGDGVGPDRVSAGRRDHHGVQQGEGRGPVDEGHVGVPVVGLAALERVDLLQERLAGWRSQRRVAQGQRAQPFGEGDLPAVVQALAAQEHHLVLQEGLADLGDHLVAQRRTGVRAGDLGTDVACQLGGSDVRGRGEGFGHD